VVFSAHWETSKKICVTSRETNSLYFDYYGFPDYTYALQYNAPGSKELAKEIKEMLGSASINCELDAERGLDHGVFIPLKLMYPAADIPVLQVSLNSNLDPNFHVQMGKAMAALRKKGILIVASGSATHNLQAERSPQKGFGKKI